MAAGVGRGRNAPIIEGVDSTGNHNMGNTGLLRDYQTRRMPMYLVHPYQGGLPRRTQVLADYLVDWFKRSGEALDRL